MSPGSGTGKANPGLRGSSHFCFKKKYYYTSVKVEQKSNYNETQNFNKGNNLWIYALWYVCVISSGTV